MLQPPEHCQLHSPAQCLGDRYVRPTVGWQRYGAKLEIANQPNSWVCWHARLLLPMRVIGASQSPGMRSWLGAEKQSGCQRASNNGRAMRCRLHTRAREKMLYWFGETEREQQQQSNQSHADRSQQREKEAFFENLPRFAAREGSRVSHFSLGPARSDCSSVVAPGQCHGGSGLKGPQQLHGCSRGIKQRQHQQHQQR